VSLPVPGGPVTCQCLYGGRPHAAGRWACGTVLPLTAGRPQRSRMQHLITCGSNDECIFAILSHWRPQELADLGTAASAEQLRTNATAAAARGMRYPVRLSAFGFELLMGFLKGARLLLPLGTINEHVDLQARGARAGRCPKLPPPCAPARARLRRLRRVGEHTADAVSESRGKESQLHVRL